MMFTPRKRHLRKKRFYLPREESFVLFNGSNLKASKLARIKLSLQQKARLYSVPLYLQPPKLSLGYPLIMVVYESLEALQTNLPEIIKSLDCLGVSIEKKWYPVEGFTKEKTTNLEKKILALLLTKTNQKD